MRALWPHGVALWMAAPVLLWLSLYRPFTPSSGRAAEVPLTVGRFEVDKEFAVTADFQRQLGTDDAIWRRYRDDRGGYVFVVTVFHQDNWKSVHPPEICLTGSGLEPFDAGRATVPVDGREYLSLYAYVAAPDFVTGSYASFFLHHAPLALIRRSVPGCLLRVESWVDPDSPEAATERCRALMGGLLREIFGLLG